MEMFKNMPLFVEVAKANSFRRASEVLEMPPSTVSRRIAELERDLGLRLFNRSTRRVELTESGRLYFDNCKRIIEEAELAHQALSELHTQPSGVLRVSMPVDFSVLYLGPVLVSFARKYPGIRFDLDLSPLQADLMGEGVDMAIRMGLPQDSQLIARPIATLETVLVANPSYLRERGNPQHPQDLLAHECLRMKDAPWVLAHADGRSLVLPVQGSLVANSQGLLKQLALQGQGIAITARDWVKDDLGAQRLVQVLPNWSPPAAQAYALTTTRLLPTKVRVFLDHLVAQLTPQPQNSV